MAGRIVNFIKGHFIILYALMALFMLAFMFYQGGIASFWLDELSLIGTITRDKGFFGILDQYLRIDVTNLPFFPLAAALWYRIMPASDRVMLLLPEIAVAFTVVLSGLYSEKLLGRYAGFMSAGLSAVSSTIILRCGFEFRSYAFLLCMCVLLLYNREKFSEKSFSVKSAQGLYFILSVVLLLYTHYMGAIFLLGLASADCLMFFLKKRPVHSLFPYIIGGAAFLPWFILMLCMKEKSIGSFWPAKPTLPKIVRVVRAMLSGNEALFVILLLSLILLAVRLCSVLANRAVLDKKLLDMLTLAWTGLFVLGSVFVYSAIINPSGGFFVNRYFVVIIPPVACLISWGIVEFTDLFSFKGQRQRAECILVCMLFLLVYFGAINLRTVREESGQSGETFREAAAWVLSRGGAELTAGKTAVVCSCNPRAAAGFTEYYLRRGGREPEISFVSLQGEEPVEELKKYDTLYVVTVHRELDDLEQDIQDYISKNYEVVDGNTDVKAFLYRRLSR